VTTPLKVLCVCMSLWLGLELILSRNLKKTLIADRTYLSYLKIMVERGVRWSSCFEEGVCMFCVCVCVCVC
jgi:hypothetical protein